MTSRNENFLQYNSKENGIIIFCCKINFGAMCKTEIVYMDGTFTYCVKHFFAVIYYTWIPKWSLRSFVFLCIKR